MKALHIGIAIKDILNENGFERVYPIIATEGTKFPFITYKRMSYYPGETKDLEDREFITVQLAVASETYAGSVMEASNVADCLRGLRGMKHGIKINNIKIKDLSEEYTDNVYIQRISLEIETINS